MLAQEGIGVELIDPRTLAPLDVDTIASSVERTGRLVVVQECPPAGSWGATAISQIVNAGFDSLDAPPVLISGDSTPVPYAGVLEQAWIPGDERIAAAIRGLE